MNKLIIILTLMLNACAHAESQNQIITRISQKIEKDEVIDASALAKDLTELRKDAPKAVKILEKLLDQKGKEESGVFLLSCLARVMHNYPHEKITWGQFNKLFPHEKFKAAVKLNEKFKKESAEILHGIKEFEYLK